MRHMSEVIKDQKPLTFSPRTPAIAGEGAVGAATAFLCAPFAKLTTGGTFSVDGEHNIPG